jgi:hypothetical protein
MLRDPPIRSRRRVHDAVGYFAIFIIAIFLNDHAAADIVGRSPRVLILYPYDERLPATAIAGEKARDRLQAATGGNIDLFSEFLDLSRFPEEAHLHRMARYMAEKYAPFSRCKPPRIVRHRAGSRRPRSSRSSPR